MHFINIAFSLSPLRRHRRNLFNLYSSLSIADAPTHTTTIVHAKPQKSVVAAFFLTFLFGPLGLLYATVAGGVVMIILAILIGAVTLGFGALITWPLSIIWGVIAAMMSKRTPSMPA
ncbi:hypothetical protein [Sulfitobacter dubius]|uniref:hypothetical protein n=1 Tax=Sulfitobacter dubius TaxID=218673 RepID=UPI0030DCED3A